MQLKAGIYNDIPEQVYHEKLEAIGSSFIAKLLGCERDAFAISPWSPYKKEEYQHSEALFFGKAMHKYLLEREQFDKEYCTQPSREGTLQAIADLYQYAKDNGIDIGKGVKGDLEQRLLEIEPGAPVWSKIEADFAAYAKETKCEVISHEKKQQIIDMAEEVRTSKINTQSGSFMLGDVFINGNAEKTFLWQHPATGIWLKCRTDWMLGNIIFEYRTTFDASERAFKRQIIDRKYHVRAGFYWKLVQELTGNAPEFYYIAQEKKEPQYLLGCYQQTQNDLAAAWEICEKALERLAEIIKKDPKDKNNWHNHSKNRVLELDFPDYAFKELFA